MKKKDLLEIKKNINFSFLSYSINIEWLPKKYLWFKGLRINNSDGKSFINLLHSDSPKTISEKWNPEIVWFNTDIKNISEDMIIDIFLKSFKLLLKHSIDSNLLLKNFDDYFSLIIKSEYGNYYTIQFKIFEKKIDKMKFLLAKIFQGRLIFNKIKND
jgi:hypothetical protein